MAHADLIPPRFATYAELPPGLVRGLRNLDTLELCFISASSSVEFCRKARQLYGSPEAACELADVELDFSETSAPGIDVQVVHVRDAGTGAQVMSKQWCHILVKTRGPRGGGWSQAGARRRMR